MPVGAALTETQLVLDNDIFNVWRYGRDGRVLAAIADYQSRIKLFPFLTSMTVYQALFGFENKSIKPGEPSEQTRQSRIRTEQFIESCDVLPFNQRSAEIAAYIMPRLSKNIPKGTLIDAFIAATALAHGCGVATRNRKDFELIASLTPNHLTLRLAVW
ncbi:MAG TPA: type II toxin-antitoxin system VapC family toxin [Pyrinomonadaceae bacterium]|jgi:predicted nucleic acid-binding protein